MTKIGIHARVWARAVFCGLIAYGFIHLLVWAMRWLKSTV